MPHLAYLSVTAIPALLLGLGTLRGGAWAVAALLWLTLVNQAADAALAQREDARPARALRTALPVALGLAHFALLALGVHALALSALAPWEKAVLFLAFGLFFGSVSNAAAHELIHRTARLPFELGKWVFISMLFGHHTSAHRLVHHPYVATPYDPNTARRGESFYRFFRRAWAGSFAAGLAAENVRRGWPAEAHPFRIGHPYLVYLAGALAFMALALALGGPKGLAAYLGLALMGQGGLLLTDYIQHYGLTRAPGPDGRFPPVSDAHSWDAAHWFTRHLTLNAPLHAAHHRRPGQPFTDLAPRPAAPRLPRSPGIMSLIALFPRRWRATVHPVLDAHNSAQPARRESA